MQTALEANRFPASRQARLRVWMLLHGVTFVQMGRHMTGLSGRAVTGDAVQKALRQDRMPVANHEALRRAYPDLPPDLLPLPQDVPPGRKPRAEVEAALPA